MPSFTAVVSALTLAAAASAQSFATFGPGRFPCAQLGTDGAPIVPAIADQSMCTTAIEATTQPCTPDATQLGNVDGGNKYFGVLPIGATCSPYTYIQSGDVGGIPTTTYYCGFVGAPCTSDENCDNGACIGDVCRGGLGYPCTLDSECLGNIYCTDSGGDSSGACGNSGAIGASTGAFCVDACAAGNYLCDSGVCDGDSESCVPFTSIGSASQRARRRRADLSDLTPRGSRCPASHTACEVTGSLQGFECIDISSNLEQCGACTATGGVDCTTLPGVDAVGCVSGVCEIWACAEGFSWAADSASCQVSLVL